METQLRDLLNGFLDALPVPIGKHIQGLIVSGEYGVGFEELCNYLYEFNTIVSHTDYEKIEAIGESMGMDASYWTLLKAPSDQSV